MQGQNIFPWHLITLYHLYMGYNFRVTGFIIYIEMILEAWRGHDLMFCAKWVIICTEKVLKIPIALIFETRLGQ